MRQKRKGIDSAALGWGFVIGLLAGGLAALFKLPRRSPITRQQLAETRQTLRSKLEPIAPVDPLAASIAEGKEAARRRRDQLGIRN